jgi:hypothetical protein
LFLLPSTWNLEPGTCERLPIFNKVIKQGTQGFHGIGGVCYAPQSLMAIVAY